jgi:hypothetical protein
MLPNPSSWSGGKTAVQTLSLRGSQLTISNGNTVTLPAGGAGNGTSVAAGAGIGVSYPTPNVATITNNGVRSVDGSEFIDICGTVQFPMVKLKKSTIGVNAGAGLAGGGSVSLGGSTTLSLPAVGTAGAYNYPLSITTDTYGRVSAVGVSATPPVMDVIGGTGITVSGTTSKTITNSGVIGITGGSGISVGGTTSNKTIANTGVLAVSSANGGIVISGTNDNKVFTNAGVLGVSSGTGISISGTNDNRTISNTGVVSLTASGGLQNTGSATTPALSIADVTSAGTYGTPTSITLNAKGQVTSIVSGTPTNASYTVSIAVNGTSVGTLNNLITSNASNFRRCKITLVGGGGGGGGGQVKYAGFPNSTSGGGGGGGSGYRSEQLVTYTTSFSIGSYILGAQGAAGATANYDATSTDGGDGGQTTFTFTFDSSNKRYMYANGGGGGRRAYDTRQYNEDSGNVSGGAGGNGYGGGGGGSSDAYFGGTPATVGVGGNGASVTIFGEGMNGAPGQWSPYRAGSGQGGDGGFSSDYYTVGGYTSDWSKGLYGTGWGAGGGPTGGRYVGTGITNQVLPIRGGGGCGGYVTFNNGVYSTPPQSGALGYIELTFF